MLFAVNLLISSSVCATKVRGLASSTPRVNVSEGEEGEVEAFWDMFEPGEMPCRDIDSVIG